LQARPRGFSLFCRNEYIFSKLTVTNDAAETCNFELNYRTNPNSKTYDTLPRIAATLRTLIADMHPSDMIDIQGFICCIGARG